MQELVSVMLESLTDFPEARAALAQALDPIDWLKEDQEPMPDVPPDEAPAALAGPSGSVSDVPAREAEPEAPARADPVEAPETTPNPQPDPPPQHESVPHQEAPAVPEPPTNPQRTGKEAGKIAEPTGNEAETKVQPTGSETPSAPPPVETKTQPPPRKPAWNPWGPLDDGTWTVVWRLQR